MLTIFPMVVLSGGVSNYIFSNGRQYSYFAGNNYLGLAGHEAVKEAAIKAVEKYGVNFSASRRTTGTADIHLELEKELASFKGQEDAVAFASGYQGNGILLEILRGSYSTVFADRSAHASIIAAIPADVTKVMFYDHCDPDHLDYLLDYNRGSNPLVITDGIFALTGEIAPLDRIYPVMMKHNGMLVVDDAHATGILGETGKGTPELFHLPDEGRVYQTETMSKALGAYGGFIAGSKKLTDMIRERSATYQASTALPPPIAAAAVAALRVMRDNPDLRTRLLDLADTVREAIIEMDFRTTHDRTPIIPVIFDSEDKAKRFSLFLEDNGFIVPFMNYPVRQGMHQVRLTVSVSHTESQVERLLELMKQWKEKYESN